MALLNTWLVETTGFLRPKENVKSNVVVTVLSVEQGSGDGNYRITVSTGEDDIVFFTDTPPTVGQQLTADIFRSVGRTDGQVVRNVRS